MQTTPQNKPLKLKPKQKLTIGYWTSEDSETFGNLYQSAIKAGFSRSYALNLSHLRPSWLSETIENAQFEPKHIQQGIQNLAKNAPNSKSPDDTRLKAWELLAKITGMTDNKSSTTINIVKPILGGDTQATTTKQQNREVIDLIPDDD